MANGLVATGERSGAGVALVSRPASRSVMFMVGDPLGGLNVIGAV